MLSIIDKSNIRKSVSEIPFKKSRIFTHSIPAYNGVLISYRNMYYIVSIVTNAINGLPVYLKTIEDVEDFLKKKRV